MLIRIVIFGIIFYLLYRFVKGLFLSNQKSVEQDDSKAIDEMVQDPYCKIYIPLREAHKRTIQGRACYFCSDECAHKYAEAQDR